MCYKNKFLEYVIQDWKLLYSVIKGVFWILKEKSSIDGSFKKYVLQNWELLYSVRKVFHIILYPLLCSLVLIVV